MSQFADFPPIEDYFIVGDLHTMALVSRQGSIDWLCLPDFGSPSIFSKLLGPSGGCLAIDMPGYRYDADYIENTAVIEFRLSGNGNKLSIRDFMVPQPTKQAVNQQLVRTVSGIRGKTTVGFIFQPKCAYGSTAPAVQITKGTLQFACDSGQIILHMPAGTSITKQSDQYKIEFQIEANTTKQLRLEYIPETNDPLVPGADLENRTLTFWRRWVGKGQYVTFRRSRLIRSAITLKLMQFYPTGAIIAAPTTSLPEEIGGVRNWDYRYVWIRDATFVLYAFYTLGYNDEAERFFTFVESVTRKCMQSFDVSLMYTVWGDAVPEEQCLDTLPGYKGSRPIRVGNQAAQQFQLDVYGSLIDAFYFTSKHGIKQADKNKWRELVMQLVRRIAALWQKPDYGIWEARTSPQYYTYSRVMAWVGVDRANRLQEPLGLTNDDLKVCSGLAESIRSWIWQHCYQAETQVLTQYPQAQSIDATNFLFVLLQFLDKHEPVSRAIIDATASQLVHKNVFVRRYLGPDGLPGGEGAFWLCSFWLISSLAILEDVAGALKLFEELEPYIAANGLLSEELDPKAGRYLGNYPQSFSHTGYIMTAYYIQRYAERKHIKLE